MDPPEDVGSRVHFSTEPPDVRLYSLPSTDSSKSSQQSANRTLSVAVSTAPELNDVAETSHSGLDILEQYDLQGYSSGSFYNDQRGRESMSQTDTSSLQQLNDLCVLANAGIACWRKQFQANCSNTRKTLDVMHDFEEKRLQRLEKRMETLMRMDWRG
ncbi:hypothetical protein M427DRAFT_44523 [Gonapodya prolifera JEL478]|uniref:Uncharacterized protein n=1 Tax=Gonapodya prolifera (strain JEL478) TaxID=1344416 RepID=A0A139AFB7_GONPJ|nr:hypothetical protein M427DRAFT_44523 [Gonapodya prolifera JEL478]|eukprot:KXS15477.1 hypothetical protein M427DRAFT_44523 [Gonapodya prolifera JEL478]